MFGRATITLGIGPHSSKDGITNRIQASQSWCKSSNAPSVRSLVMDEERSTVGTLSYLQYFDTVSRTTRSASGL